MRFTALLGLLAFSPAVFPAAPVGDLPDPETAIWTKVKRSLFEGRPVSSVSGGIVELVAPSRADDGAVVPIAIRTKLAQSRERYIRRLYLIVDNNPSPLAAKIELTTESGLAELETRIRIEQYTYVRAVAELSDGTLAADARYVKASGGCSAAAPRDAAAAASIGQMRLAVERAGAYNEPARAQLMISHPNDSGLVMDQITRLYTPAYFVRSVTVTYADKPVLAAEVDFSISENPWFRFYFVPSGEGELKAEAVDTKGLKFETRTALGLSASRMRSAP